jgi:G3E family GTPase
MNPVASGVADDRTPVHLLTGFLGSGKTTLLRQLLADPTLADTAVIINEFGEVGLDQLLVHEVIEDVVLLSSGCLCCSVRDDLLSTLADLDRMQRNGEIPRFSRAVVETTGLADPAPIMQAILSDRRLAKTFRLGAVITTVDGVNGAATLEAHREARQQLAMADRVVVTKCDQAEPAARSALVERLKALNPGADLRQSGLGQTAAASLLAELDLSRLQAPTRPTAAASLEDAGRHPHTHAHEATAAVHDGSIGTFTVRLPHPVPWDAFVDWLELLLASRGDSILRVKGLLAVAGDDRPVVVQGVQHVLYPPERLLAWPPGSPAGGWIVFIARDLTPTAIEGSLRSLWEESAAPDQG